MAQQKILLRAAELGLPRALVATQPLHGTVVVANRDGAAGYAADILSALGAAVRRPRTVRGRADVLIEAVQQTPTCENNDWSHQRRLRARNPDLLCCLIVGVAPGGSTAVVGLRAAVAILASLRGPDAGGDRLTALQIDAVPGKSQLTPPSAKEPAAAGMSGPFPTADQPLMVAIDDDDDDQFRKLCMAIGVPWLATYPRFATGRRRLANLPELRQLVGGRLQGFGADHWLRVFGAAGIDCAVSR